MTDAIGASTGPKRYRAAHVEFSRERAFRSGTSAQLDLADLHIIDTLVVDGRANNRSMAARAGLTEETVSSRLRSLVERNIIGISAIVDWSAAGFQWDLYLAISCDDDPIPSLTDALGAFDEVISINAVLGSVDLVAHVLCQDQHDLLKFLSTTLTQITGIRRVDVLLALDTVKFFHQFAWVPVPRPKLAFPSPIVDLSELDLSIIDAVVSDGRVSNREIGRELGVADGTVRSHLRRLESSGLLRVCAQVHPVRSGMVGARAFVGIAVHGTDSGLLASKLAGIAEIVTIAVTSGRFELFCYVMARSRARLVELIAEEIRPMEGVCSTETWEVIAGAKHISHWARW